MDRKIVRSAWEKWGTDLQLVVVVEECSELIQAIAKHQRGLLNFGELALEVADVEIMLAFMREYLGDDAIDDAVSMKTKRLERRVSDG